MLMPLYDENPLRSIKRQYVTIGIILVNIVVFAFVQQGVAGGGGVSNVTLTLGMIPAELFGGQGYDLLQTPMFSVNIPDQLTPLTYMFLHGSWLHLLGNMLFLWVLGDNVEDAMGHLRFLFFYLACGVLAGLFQSWILPGLTNPVIGASGAVAGVIGAYLVLHPKVMMWALVFRTFPVQLRAVWILAFWVVFQLVNIFTAGDAKVAWGTHIGGLLAGVLLVVVLKRSDVKLFQ